LIGEDGRPAAKALEVLAAIDDPHFTTELALFNLEFNLDPFDLAPNVLSQMENQILELLEMAHRGAEAAGARVVLTGILPTLEKSDLTLANMTPKPRYFALNQAIQRLRGSAFEFNINGIEELTVSHESVMLEACNTSFQIHFQVNPGRFARLYNAAQAVAAPVLAAAVNSPLLFGKRLWSETRIALFQQSVDTRTGSSYLRHQEPRVSFGDRWLDDSVLEIFREDIARFRVLLSDEISEDPAAALDRGEVPSLRALRLHNGTVYRWNRPCYGILGGKPHLRIENRILPSGPTPRDEVANAAFWFGLVHNLADQHDPLRSQLEFDEARQNFFAAARSGLNAQFNWLGHQPIAAADLVLGELLDRSRQGLADLGIAAQEIETYLGVIHERVESRRTGSRWALDSLAGMRGAGTPTERMAALTLATLENQKKGAPVSAWPPAGLEDRNRWKQHYSRVGDLMSTDLFTVNQDDLLDLVACLMDWKYIRHVPVEAPGNRLVGLVTHRTLLRHMASGQGQQGESIPVHKVMETKLYTAGPNTPTLEALDIMQRHQIGCLPVVEGDRLVGIITEGDLAKISGQVLRQLLAD
jgi:CBS domain-containing protein